jgi:hypothetical protein
MRTMLVYTEWVCAKLEIICKIILHHMEIKFLKRQDLLVYHLTDQT